MLKRVPKILHPTNRGLVHAYIGDGKGKTTAAVGTIVRAVGYGWKVLFLQFMKNSTWPSGERQSLRQLGVDVLVMGQGFYKILDDHSSATEHKAAAADALRVASEKICSGSFQLVVLDELGSAVEEGLLEKRAVEKFLRLHQKDTAAKNVHLIWTGHKKIGWMLKYADLVTDMQMVKHPYYRGIIATRGLDY